MHENLEEIIAEYKNKVGFCTTQLIITCQTLIRVIERATRYTPPSNKYQIEFLEQIDKQLAQGQGEASFWREKLVLQKVEKQ